MAKTSYVGKPIDNREFDLSALMGDGEEFEKLSLPKPTEEYRKTTIGKVLDATLAELLEQGKITENLSTKIKAQFDRKILNALSQRLTSSISFKAEKLHTYRFMDGVWTFSVDYAEFRQYTSFANVDKLKIVAFDGKVQDKRLATGGKRKWRKTGQEDERKT
ncbi:Transcription initiation factor IIA subunit 2 [Orchesella cincta]|uniref:Transcription initiation factor IIA subunit 2 n=1 Tax=Orchesella cincta TaxID=48709 RepID=A0A1D2NK54_ORCCI|nr:Transcription initiation factor IIA subunit 2 [Orchesella cincta]